MNANVNSMANVMVSTMANVKGCKFMEISYLADCGFTKKSGLNGIIKRVVLNAEFNYSYENAVNNRLEKEGIAPTFVAQSLPWGTWLVANKIIEHKGKYYLRYYTHKSTKPQVTYFEADGTPCSATRITEIRSYLASKAKPFSQTQADAGLVTNQVEPKVVAFENIEKITIGGIDLTQTTTLRVAE